MSADPIHPEGLYACEGCRATFPEYINGCPHCWDADLTIEQNRRKYPRRRVALVALEP